MINQSILTPEAYQLLVQQSKFQKPGIKYYDFNTKNQSFIDMFKYLQARGIKNNAFMLLLYDPDLANINPHQPNLPEHWKARVLRECMLNYWYFIREVVKVPTQGITQGSRYKLHRGNLAYNFCSLLNLNIYEILTRQQFKTMSAAIRYLYLFNFGTTYSSIYFLNQNHDKSKENLQHVKNVRALLPSYLRMDQPIPDGRRKVMKIPDRAETLGHLFNANVIKTVPSARNRIAAGNLIRGKTVPLIWFDEYAFIPYNEEVYLNGVPAYKTAAMNAQRNGKAYGLLITTTPGDLMTEEGDAAFTFRNDCTKFDESWYDLPYSKIMAQIEKNRKTNFVRIEYDYKQLGLSEKWFEEICIDMRYNWEKIRREILLEWNISTPNAFFTMPQLEEIKRHVHDPIKTLMIFDKYPIEIYREVDYTGGQPMYPPIIGVDVSGGLMRDSSAITIIDSKTTMPFACFKDNSIDPDDLAYVIIELVTKYMPNAVVCVEKTGIGLGPLKILMKSKIKHNLYWELKERIVEERNDGIHIVKHKIKTKVYGLDNTKQKRPELIQILKERGRDHKDKFVIKELWEEFRGLEVKKNGFVEHSDKSHDDLTFSYLMAMYVWYYGHNLQQWGIEKEVLKTDTDEIEENYGEENKTNVADEMKKRGLDGSLEDNEGTQALELLKKLQDTGGMMYHQWEEMQFKEDQEALNEILMSRPGREAYAKKYNIPDQKNIKPINNYARNYALLSKLLFQADPEEEERKLIAKNLSFNSFMNRISKM